MKNRIDKILLAVFLLSLALESLFILTWLEIVPVHHLEWPYWAQVLNTCLALSFSVVPAFCLQLLLCRTAGRGFAALPGLVIVGAALYFTGGWLTVVGWDSLGYGIMLMLTAAPAAGCALGWAAFGLRKLYQKGDIHHDD